MAYHASSLPKRIMGKAVVGRGGITIIDPTNLSYSSMDRAGRGEPVSLIDVKLHILVAGGRFDIASRQAHAGE